MALFGYSADIDGVGTERFLVSAASWEEADTLVVQYLKDAPHGAVIVEEAERLVLEQFNGIAVLSTDFGGC